MINNSYRVAITLIFVLVLSLFISYIRLSFQKENLSRENLNKIDGVLSTNFEEVEKILIFTGNKIASDTPNLDLKVIYKIFVNVANVYNYNHPFSWSLFDWVDMNGYQTVNTMLGIRKDPPYIGPERSYVHRGNSIWSAIFSEVVIGNPSGLKVIPVGVQIETAKHPRAGVVVLGLNVKRLADIIDLHIDKNIEYAVIDIRDNKLAIGSYNSEKYFQNYLESNKYSKEDYRIYTKEMEEKYPYRILVKYNQSQLWQEVISSSILLSSQIIGIALVVIFIKKPK